jgi:hypothetical protein
MKQDEFIPIFRKLHICYGARLVPKGSGKEETREYIQVWYQMLRDLSPELVQAAALEYMTSPAAFPPTPGQIRHRAMTLIRRTNRVPSPEEAWEEVSKAPVDGIVRRSEETETGWHIYNEPYQWSHPIVGKVARNLGWPRSFWTDNQAADRARFINAYERQLDYSTEEMSSLPEVQNFIERNGAADIKELTDTFRRQALDRGE